MSTNTSPMWLVYEDAEGTGHHQPWNDVAESGTPIDPETDAEMDLIGWTTRFPGSTPVQPQPVILAVTHYADKVRDMNIAVTMFDSEDAARAALREDFADELAETADDEYADQDRDLLDILRWDHNVIAEITPFNLLQFNLLNL